MKHKPIITLARYAIKRNGRFTGVIIHLVTSSDGVTTYRVTALNGRASGCTCPARKGCKHRAHVEQVEQERAQQEHKAREESPLTRKRFDLLRAS